MNITALTHLEHEGDRGYDAVVPQVAAALKQGGHKVSVLGVHGDVGKLFAGLKRRKPDLVFNLMETFGDTQLGAVAVVGFLDLLGVPYTGGGPGEFYIQEDKALAKKLLAFDHIRYPEFAVFSPDADLETAGSLRLPLFVKPLRMDASIGIDAGSLVHSTREMLERVALIHEQVHDAALVEEYVEGREFYVGVLGNQEALAFPPIEMDFSGLPEGAPPILDARAKWDEGSPEFQGTKAVLAEVAPEVAARLRQAALDACRALRVRDYGRVDLRLTPAGEVYVIEVNASCYLERGSEFVAAAAAAGIDYPTLINRIAELAQDRYKRQPGEPSPVRSRRRRRAGTCQRT
jgi:D-alanine-D-alanine ligase